MNWFRSIWFWRRHLWWVYTTYGFRNMVRFYRYRSYSRGSAEYNGFSSGEV